MIPLSEGSRGLATPSSIVTTAGSGNSTVSLAPSSCRSAVPSPPAISSFETAVTHGSPTRSAVIGPTVWLALSVAIRPKSTRS